MYAQTSYKAAVVIGIQLKTFISFQNTANQSEFYRPNCDFIVVSMRAQATQPLYTTAE